MSNDAEMTGTVCWFDPRKGFGYISKDDGSGDIFVHWSNIDMDNFKTLKPDQIVKFTIGENHKGPQAENVVITRDVDDEDTF